MGDQVIENFTGQQVAIGLQHDLSLAAIFFLKRVEDRKEFRPLGQRRAPRKDEPVELRRQIADNGEAILGRDAFTLGSGVIVAVRTGIVAELGENPVDRFVMFEVGRFHRA